MNENAGEELLKPKVAGSDAEKKEENFTLSEEEKGHLSRLLDVTLRDETLTENYSTVLNGMFRKLNGENHTEWERRFGNRK